MPDVDEHLLTAAKLREQVNGNLDGDGRLLDHVGIVQDDHDASVFSFLENAMPDFSETELSTEITSKALADTATTALNEGNGAVLSHLVGVTEQELDASNLMLPLRLLEELENNAAPAFVTCAGNPNSGKTNFLLLLAELRKADLENLEVITNFNSGVTDHRITSAHELMVTLLELKDVPKFVLLDEASTHFDARTYSYEISTQWTPLAKRFAKIGVDCCAVSIHTGKDLHPEAKRMTTLAAWKHEKERLTLYDNWSADADEPDGEIYRGDLENLQPTGAHYDPDAAAPWSWNLDTELFTLDLDWSELLDELKERGPDNS